MKIPPELFLKDNGFTDENIEDCESCLKQLIGKKKIIINKGEKTCIQDIAMDMAWMTSSFV